MSDAILTFLLAVIIAVALFAAAALIDSNAQLKLVFNLGGWAAIAGAVMAIGLAIWRKGSSDD